MKRKHSNNSGNKNHYNVPQLSYDCRRKIQRAQDFAFWLYMHHCDSPLEVAPHVIHAFSYIADDIEYIDKELISLGLFDESMGIRPSDIPRGEKKKGEQ